jgi:nucleoside-diphosphate-sugar epimerase
MQTALLTGATGFIGGHLVQHLASLGWKIHALARKEPSDYEIAKLASWHIYEDDYASVLRAMELSQPDVVFHLASLFLSEHRPDQIDELIDANLRLGMHTLEAMRQRSVSRLINAGSSWQHFNSSDYDPVNLYAATKQAFEAIIDYYSNAHKLASASLKLHDTYGDKDNRNKLLPYLLNAFKNKKKLQLSDGYQRIHITHVKEICRALVLSTTVLEVGAHKRLALDHVGEEYSIREIVSLCEEILEETLSIEWGVIPTRKRNLERPARIKSEQLKLDNQTSLRNYILKSSNHHKSENLNE